MREISFQELLDEFFASFQRIVAKVNGVRMSIDYSFEGNYCRVSYLYRKFRAKRRPMALPTHEEMKELAQKYNLRLGPNTLETIPDNDIWVRIGVNYFVMYFLSKEREEERKLLKDMHQLYSNKIRRTKFQA